MDHLALMLSHPRAVQRVVTVLAARGVELGHLHLDRDRLCLLVPDGIRAALLLGRLVDVSEVQVNGPCLVARNVFVPLVMPRVTGCDAHRWLRPQSFGNTA